MCDLEAKVARLRPPTTRPRAGWITCQGHSLSRVRQQLARDRAGARLGRRVHGGVRGGGRSGDLAGLLQQRRACPSQAVWGR